MTQQQLATVAQSLATLSVSDKLELVARLVHDLRTNLPPADAPPTTQDQPPTEAEFKQSLLASGLMSRLPLAPTAAPRPEFDPVPVVGESLSATIIRERR